MIVDARGMLCPQPIMETKKVLDTLTLATDIEVYIDDDIAMCNVEAYLGELGIECSSRKKDDIYIISFNSGSIQQEVDNSNDVKPDDVDAQLVVESTTTAMEINCVVEPKVGYVVVVKSISMGGGSQELGEMLLKTFVSTLAEADRLPSHIIMYNEGVKTLKTGSSFISAFKLLESKGVKILACGVCVDYYDMKGMVEIGTISNMYRIVELVTSSSKVVYP